MISVVIAKKFALASRKYNEHDCSSHWQSNKKAGTPCDVIGERTCDPGTLLAFMNVFGTRTHLQRRTQSSNQGCCFEMP